MNRGVPITNPAAALRLFRILKICFAVSQILFLYFLVIKVPVTTSRPPDPTVEKVITVLALANVVLGFVLPRYFLRAGLRASRAAQPPNPIQRWVTASVVGFAFLESCSLFGVALHFLGAALRHSELLIGVAIIAIVFFSPGALPGSVEGNSSQS